MPGGKEYVPGQPLEADDSIRFLIDELRRAGRLRYKADYPGVPDPRERSMQLLSAYNPQGVEDPLGDGLGDYDNPISRGLGNVSKSLGKAVYNRMVSPVLEAMNASGRMRDTGIKSMQSAAAGEYEKAASLARRIPLSAFQMDGAAPGSPGSPDDWREDAERLGISPENTMALDLFTDPGMYLGVPMARGLRAAGDLADVARYVRSGMKYGFAGIPTELVDNAGNVIRRLPNSPVVQGSRPVRPSPALRGLLSE